MASYPVLTAPKRSAWRWVLAPAATVAAASHIPVIAPHLAEAPYMGVLFIVLTAACLVLAIAVLIRDTAAVYGLAILTCGLAIVGYIATRSVAFPQLADDVGNWLEPLGIVAILAEAVVVIAAVKGVAARR
ncbi:MAG: hypothetical protein M3Y48_16055 [Actinomycetota bacterium]|nr:hypothetical protein [Actinomycetota bacterium]